MGSKTEERKEEKMNDDDLRNQINDLIRDEIVEIGAISASSGHVFSTVVLPTILPDGVGVHGIGNDELLCGPRFRLG